MAGCIDGFEFPVTTFTGIVCAAILKTNNAKRRNNHESILQPAERLALIAVHGLQCLPMTNASDQILTITQLTRRIKSLLEGELGQYLNRELISRLRGCGGIRIEDNVVVTENGSRNLTRGS